MTHWNILTSRYVALQLPLYFIWLILSMVGQCWDWAVWWSGVDNVKYMMLRDYGGNYNNEPPVSSKTWARAATRLFATTFISLSLHVSACLSISVFPFAPRSNKRWLICQAPRWLAAQQRHHTLCERWRWALLSYRDAAKWVSLSKHTRCLWIRLIETHSVCPEPNAMNRYWSPASCLCHIWLSVINAVPAL